MYVDDDRSFLNKLRLTMPRRLRRDFRDSPDAAVLALHGERPYWKGLEATLAGASGARDEGGGEVAYWVREYFNDWRRFHLTSVLVVDYNMPGMSGVELLDKKGDHPARSVLLTGVADSEVAVQAFNSGAIHKFLSKGTSQLYQAVTLCIDEMHAALCDDHSRLLRSTLESWQVDLLRDPSIASHLSRTVDALRWSEYVVVSHPFGLMGMADGGPLQWVQIETDASFRALAESLEEIGAPAEEIHAARKRTSASLMELQTGLQSRLASASTPTMPLCSVPLTFVGTVVDLPVAVRTAETYGFDDLSTVEGVMDRLLGDVLFAHDVHPGLSGTSREARDEALSALATMAAYTDLHGDALTSVLSRSKVFPSVMAEIELAVERARLALTRHDRQR